MFYFLFQIIFKIVKSVALSKSREHFTLEYIALNNSRSDCLVKAVVHSLPSEGQALRTFNAQISRNLAPFAKGKAVAKGAELVVILSKYFYDVPNSMPVDEQLNIEGGLPRSGASPTIEGPSFYFYGCGHGDGINPSCSLGHHGAACCLMWIKRERGLRLPQLSGHTIPKLSSDTKSFNFVLQVTKSILKGVCMWSPLW